MPKRHPYTQEELILRKRARSHRRYLEQKKLQEYYYIMEHIQDREQRALLLGKPIISWTVEQELALFAEYKHTCSFCDLQKDKLELSYKDVAGPHQIENMLPICYSCLIDRLAQFSPQLIIRTISIGDLPSGYNRIKLFHQSKSLLVKVVIGARLTKHNFEAVILPAHQYQNPAHLFEFGEPLFEVEARSLFPEYQLMVYKAR